MRRAARFGISPPLPPPPQSVSPFSTISFLVRWLAELAHHIPFDPQARLGARPPGHQDPLARPPGLALSLLTCRDLSLRSGGRGERQNEH
jgi:hypothetical protein